MQRFSLHWLAAVLLIVAPVGALDQVNKPVREVRTQPDHIAPLATLNETWLATDLIVRGRVLGSGPMDKQIGSRGALVRTAQRVKVLDVFRAPQGTDGEAGELIFLQSGGERDRPDHIQRVVREGFPLLQPGREYVLFLAKAEGGAWGSAYGPDGVFENVNGMVQPFGGAETSLRQKGLKWHEFIRVLTNFGIQGAAKK